VSAYLPLWKRTNQQWWGFEIWGYWRPDPWRRSQL
jgi:hypothetical protein